MLPSIWCLCMSNFQGFPCTILHKIFYIHWFFMTQVMYYFPMLPSNPDETPPQKKTNPKTTNNKEEEEEENAFYCLGKTKYTYI